MWNRSLYAVVVMLVTSLVQAQQGFIKYTSDLGASRFNMVELPSGNLLVGMAQFSGVSLLSGSGSVLFTKRYEVDTFLRLQSVIRTQTGFAFVGIYAIDSCPNGVQMHSVWGMIDSLGNVLNANYYSLSSQFCSNEPYHLEASATGDFIMWGKQWQFFSLRCDGEGAVRWAKRYPNRGGFRFIKELPGGDLLAGINMDTAGAAVGRMDAEGNFLWLKSYFRPKGMIADALIEDDGTVIITGFTDSLAAPGFLNPLPPTYWPKLFVMKLSGDGEVLWCKGYDISPYRWYTRPGARIERHHDGNYILLGNIGGLNHPFGYRPQLMKLDHNGDTLWTRSAGREGHVHDIINMTVCSDGGILYNGQSLSNSPDMFIFKTDSLGYLPCYNRWHATTIVDLFPVDSSFTLTSIDGATAHPAFITEAENPPITIIDGCSTGTEREGMRPSGFRVYPNPTPGRFTLEVPDPLLKDSYYSVYDALGKLLYQRPLPAGATVEEVDRSRFGRGTYVVKLTDPEGVRWERVVLE
jgi:hypothetical protein